MSTHALVGVMHGSNYKAIYVHSDGYLSYTGKVLFENYNSSKANHLVSMGDCSVLGKEIGEKIDFNDRMQCDSENVATQCRFYTRDRDERTPFTTYDSIDEATRSEFQHIYVMKNGDWYYVVDKTLVRLADALSKEIL